MGQVFRECNEAKWEQVRTHPYFANAVAAITKETEALLATDPPRVKFSEIHLFATTGDRMVYQNKYNEYITRMENYFFMYLLTREEKYLLPLGDIIWNICDFETWALPAHAKEHETPHDRRIFLDLCSTIMGFRIAEILYFIGDKLPDLLVRRARWEIRTRVIDSYATGDAWWMRSTNNWSAVCIGATLAAYLYLGETEALDKQLPRMLETIECYLRGFHEDGCCLEGYGYWVYGFSYFCLFASLLREYTDGEIDLFRREKVHNIARFPQNVAINETELISFSDCGLRFSPNAWLTQFLKREYPDLESPAFEESPKLPGYLRYFLWQDPDLASGKMCPESHIFPDAQWFIHRSPAYNLAAKAGHNSEPHNHNDIGSFLFSKDGAVSFTDPGGGVYTRQYFSSERYNSIATSSRGHSVPIINGEYQVTGTIRSQILAESDREYCFTMENGYAIPTLTSLVRRIECKGDRVCITDSYRFSEMPTGIVERFVSYQKPILKEGAVHVGNAVLTFEPTRFTVLLSEEEFINGNGASAPLYLIDLCPHVLSTDFTLTFEIA